MSDQARYAVLILGVGFLLALGFIGVLALQGKEVPAILQTVAGSTVTGLLGVMVPTRQPLGS